MNISYNWLSELIDIYLPPEEVAHALTFAGLTVEGVHPVGDDFILDVDLTSNRPDCLSHLGVAREISAITGVSIKNQRDEATEIPMPPVLAYDIVRIDDADLCHRFTARIIRDVKIGPSPDWLVKRLEAIGERAINNVADITNYVMHELGQPMHAFDLNKLAENRIVVRRAKKGETIKTLDEINRQLDETMLAICDAEKPVAVAGVMGGLDSGITSKTTNVLLEVAYFKRENIRQTSRKLKLTTEASHRFERGVDINNLQRASDRAAALIGELAGGTLGAFIDVYPTPFTPDLVESPDISAAVKRLTGLEVDAAECVRILNSLGIAEDDESQIDGRKSKIFISPSWRHDIAIEEDLVEEVVRITGYEKVADELPPAFGAGEYQEHEPRKIRIRRALIASGFDETVNYSFIDSKFDEMFGPVPNFVDETLADSFMTLRDAVIEGAVRMRPTLLPGLLGAVRLNFNHQRKNLQLFEFGKAFAATNSEDGLPSEHELLGFAITGGEVLEDHANPGRELDFYDAKGAVETALENAGYPSAEFRPTHVKHLRKGQAAEVRIAGRPIGSLGRLNQEISDDYKFRQPVYVAEIDLTALFTEDPDPVRYSPLPKFPSVTRDVSFSVAGDVLFADIRSEIVRQDYELLRSVAFVDEYKVPDPDDNMRSVTVRLEYRNNERTLIDEEVDAVHDALIASVENNLKIFRKT